VIQNALGMSGYSPRAAQERTCRKDRIGPILLQKDFAHLTAQD
jgi:hypothetical protein